ncbi:MAG: BamA/TamA family outer membrane protein [Bacteroidota bacterium]
MLGQDTSSTRILSEVEMLPVIAYDSDVGFGYGAKVFFLNQLGKRESFDVTLFNSTEGERWYRIVFSYPDIEVRQGTTFDYAFDLMLDYDKWIKNSYFGIGNGSQYSSREYYTREPIELTVAVSRGCSPTLAVMIGMRAKKVWNSNIPDSSTITLFPSSSSASGFVALFRYDSRNSAINPRRGTVVQMEMQTFLRLFNATTAYSQIGITVQNYTPLAAPNVIAAVRITANQIIGTNIPVQHLLSVGGNHTLRGSPQDRYLDKVSIVANGELRFPLVWRFGGIAGFDSGKVWHLPRYVDLVEWETNAVIGLRFSMDTFVVRADVGFGSDATGFYLNFGHLF